MILLQDVNFNDLHSLVEFIYHGEVNVHQKSLQSFLKTAEVLRVSGLTQQQAEEPNSVSKNSTLKNLLNFPKPQTTTKIYKSHSSFIAITSNTKSRKQWSANTYKFTTLLNAG